MSLARRPRRQNSSLTQSDPRNEASQPRYQAVPVGFTDDGALLLAMANPTNVSYARKLWMRLRREAAYLPG